MLKDLRLAVAVALWVPAFVFASSIMSLQMIEKKEPGSDSADLLREIILEFILLTTNRYQPPIWAGSVNMIPFNDF